MPKLDGLAVARQLRVRRLPTEILFLTIHNEQDLFQAAMDIGAKGYLIMDIAVTEIVKALRAVASGEYYVTPSLAGHLVHHQRRIAGLIERQPGLETLTPTERRILLMVAEARRARPLATNCSFITAPSKTIAQISARNFPSTAQTPCSDSPCSTRPTCSAESAAQSP